MGRSSTLKIFTAASVAWLGWAMRGRMTQACSSLIAAMRSSSRSDLRNRSSTSAMVTAGAGPRISACRRSTRRSSTSSTARRPLVARATAVSRSRSFIRSSRLCGTGASDAAAGPAAGAGGGGMEALNFSCQVEFLEIEVVGARGKSTLDEHGLVAAALRVVEEIEHRRMRRARLVGSGHDEHARLQAAHLVVRDHDRHFAGGELDEGSHRKDADRGNELLHQGLVEELARPAADAAQRLVGRRCRRVGAVVGERRERVDDARHAPVDADLVAHVAVRIAAAVHALVVLLDAFEHLGVAVRRLRKNRDAVRHVALRLLVLFRREAALLVEEIARQLDLADVEQEPDLRELRELRPRKADMA